jgi:glutathione S-transferase
MEDDMLKIYGQARSRAFRVIWLCKESNIAYEHIPVSINIEGAQAKEPWYVQLNPNARVPTIDDDGFIMWESAAINMYLADKYKSPLLPGSAAGKGRALQWAFFISNDVEGPMIQMFQHRVAFPPEKRVAALAEEGEKKLRPKLQILDDQLGRTPYFGADKWDLADFMVASVTYTLFGMKYDLAQFPRFGAWLNASVERPAAREARKLRE